MNVILLWIINVPFLFREFVLSSGTEVCTDNNGQRFMFSNWQYGTLHSKVQAGKVKLSESEAFSLFSKIVRGIAFCHACGIVVRDVKLRKFVFTDKQMQVFLSAHYSNFPFFLWRPSVSSALLGLISKISGHS